MPGFLFAPRNGIPAQVVPQATAIIARFVTVSSFGEIAMFLCKRAVCAGLIFTLWSAPSQARFLQTDPVGYSADANLYTYASNDPANRVDPTGRDSYIVGRPVQDPRVAAAIAFAAAAATGNAAGAPAAALAAYKAALETKHSFLVVTKGHNDLRQNQPQERFSYGPSTTSLIDPGNTVLQGPTSLTSTTDSTVLSDLKHGTTDPGVSFSKISGIDDATAKIIFGAPDAVHTYAAIPATTSNGTNSNSEAFARAEAAAGKGGSRFAPPEGIFPGSDQARRINCPTPSGTNMCGGGK